jgi:selenide,water dikinase
VLSEVLSGLPLSADPNLLVGFDTADDAAVYRLSPELAIVSTIDYITPVVDDPVWFGRIAAANALSDVWAMGGRPVLALSVVNFPAKDLDLSLLRGVLAGAAEKVVEAGACLAGGHSVEDPEPKFGLAVTGVVHPGRVLTNGGARPGDAIVLTKPLGNGVLFNASLAGKYPYAALERDVLPSTAALNKTACEAALGREVRALTDVTGFGIGGHALEMAAASAVRFVISFKALPLYPGTIEMYRAGVTTGSNAGNRAFCGQRLRFAAKLRHGEEEVIFDPQTSGGLLAAMPEGQAGEYVRELHAAGIPSAAIIGRAETGDPGITVVG